MAATTPAQVAEECFTALAIKPPLDERETELVEQLGIDEGKYQVEKRLLFAFTIEYGLSLIGEGTEDSLAGTVLGHYAQLWERMERGSPNQIAVAKAYALRSIDYRKAAQADQDPASELGLEVAQVFAARFKGASDAATKLLKELGTAHYVAGLGGIRQLIADYSADPAFNA